MSSVAMATVGPGAVLLGRRSEIEVLDRLLAGARGGRSGVLVLSGEPGIGKTALLEYAVGGAHGFQVARTVGVDLVAAGPISPANAPIVPTGSAQAASDAVNGRTVHRRPPRSTVKEQAR
jgi:hypothetical protein